MTAELSYVVCQILYQRISLIIPSHFNSETFGQTLHFIMYIMKDTSLENIKYKVLYGAETEFIQCQPVKHSYCICLKWSSQLQILPNLSCVQSFISFIKGETAAEIQCQLFSVYDTDVTITQNIHFMNLQQEEIMFIIRKRMKAHLLSLIGTFKKQGETLC